MSESRLFPTAVASKTLNRLRARGFGEVLSLGWHRVREWVTSSDELVMFVGDPASGAEELSGVTFREASAADADRYARDIGTDSASTFRARLTETTRCFVVDDGRLLVHASWVTTSRAWTRELRSYLTVPHRGAYIYESFTRAEVRGRGIYPFALRRIAAWAADSGIDDLWVAVEADNPASLRAVTKAGFAEAFRLPYRRRIGWVVMGQPSGPRAEIVANFVSRSRPSSGL